MCGFGCVPVRDVGLLVGCIYGYGRLMWVRQSDPDGKLILNTPVGSSAVPLSTARRPTGSSKTPAPERGGPVGPKSLVGGCAPALSPQWRMLALRLLRTSVRGAMPIDGFFAGADVVLWGVLLPCSAGKGPIVYNPTLIRLIREATQPRLDAWALV